jgi:hypothetical protein
MQGKSLHGLSKTLSGTDRFQALADGLSLEWGSLLTFVCINSAVALVVAFHWRR